MANKKITVVGDGAEQPLTPEEEHRLEVRVDQMLDPNLPDTETQPATEPQPTEKVGEAELPAAPAATPKVTKIVTKFADEEDEPAPKESKKEETPKPLKPKAAPELSAAEPTPKPVAKKIAIKHHEDEAPEAKKPAPKHTKAKAATKKPEKKLKVTVSDGSEPEDLASKADAIAAAAKAAEEQLESVKEPSKAETVPHDEPTPAETTSDEIVETADDRADGAPPLIQKHSVAPIGVAENPEVPEAPKSPSTSKKIAISHDENTEEPTDEPEVATSVPAEPATVTEITIEEQPEEAETIEVEAESKPEPDTEAQATGDETKKYRPPEGPIQFKRAEVPIQPHKPGQPRTTEAPVSELSEDEALAQAFEAKASTKSDALRTAVSGTIHILKWAVVIAVIAGVIAVGAVPSWRHKALSLVGVDTTARVSGANPATTQNQATAEPATQDVYLAKRAGIYNLYRSNTDGQQEQLILAGTGNETSRLALAPNATNTLAAFVSTRDNKKNAAGDLQQSLTLVNVASGAVTTLDAADQVKLVDWIGERLVYVLHSTSTSTTDANRYQLVSYNTTTKVRTVLDHLNYLNDVLSAQGSVYYATATSPSGSGQFVSIKPDGSSKKVILSTEIAAITRTSYNQVVLSGVSKWYSYKLGDTQATLTNNAGQTDSRLYVDSPDGKRSVYIADSGVLTTVDTTTGTETLSLATSATYPVHWLSNDTLVYRQDGADYLLKISGGQPTKITDVSDAPGISLWHEQ